MSDAGTDPAKPRPIWPAIRKGLRCKCPKCGKGKLYPRYIEQTAQCSVCGEPLDHYNVGLLLPFVVIMIVAHVLIFVMLEMELHGTPSPMIYLAVLVPLSLIIPLIILPSVKGAIIGILWARNLSDELDQ
jgi:uncharacterized protein (DUF983 family)